MDQFSVFRWVILSALMIFAPMTVFGVEDTSDTGMMVAQNKKTKKRGGKVTKKKGSDSSTPSDTSEPAPEGSEPQTDSTSARDNGSQYVYRDTFGAAPARYNVSHAKVTKSEVEAALIYQSLSSKTDSDASHSSVSASGPRLYGLVTVPFSKVFSAGGGIDYLSINYTISYSNDYASGSTKATFTNFSIPAHLVAHLTPNFDVGMQLNYNAIDSIKSESSTTSYSYLTMKPSVGVHSNKYEASLGYQPLVKAKGKLTATKTDSESTSDVAQPEKEVASEMSLNGRFLVAPKIFVGAGYEVDSEKESKDSILSFEVGLNGAGFQVAAGLDLKSKKSESTADASTGTENGFVIEAVSLDQAKQPRFSAALSYAPTSEKSEGSSSSGSILIIGASAQIHF